MPAAQPTIFVFWGYRCDEVAAVTYISGLRRLGLRVQVLGIAVHSLEGAYGVTIQPDLLISEALLQAKRALCVILPFDDAALQRFAEDERFQRFLHISNSKGAWFVTQDETESPLRLLLTKPQVTMKHGVVSYSFAISAPNANIEIISYSAGDELIGLVNHLALQLLAKVTKRQKK